MEKLLQGYKELTV